MGKLGDFAREIRQRMLVQGADTIGGAPLGSVYARDSGFSGKSLSSEPGSHSQPRARMALPQSPDRSTRAVGLRHHWLVAAVDRRSTMGPNTVCHVEQSLAAVEHLQVEPSLGL